MYASSALVTAATVSNHFVNASTRAAGGSSGTVPAVWTSAVWTSLNVFSDAWVGMSLVRTNAPCPGMYRAGLIRAILVLSLSVSYERLQAEARSTHSQPVGIRQSHKGRRPAARVSSATTTSSATRANPWLTLPLTRPLPLLGSERIRANHLEDKIAALVSRRGPAHNAHRHVQMVHAVSFPFPARKRCSSPTVLRVPRLGLAYTASAPLIPSPPYAAEPRRPRRDRFERGL